MHQITIRLLLGIVISQSIQNSNIVGLRQISPDVNNCMRALSSKAVYLNLHQHILNIIFTSITCFIYIYYNSQHYIINSQLRLLSQLSKAVMKIPRQTA